MKVCVFNTTNNLIQPLDIAASGLVVANVSVTSLVGEFAVAHNLLEVPTAVLLQMTSNGEIWFQDTPFDDTFLYLTASTEGLTAIAACFTGGGLLVANIPPFSQPPAVLVEPNGGTTYSLPTIPGYPAGSFYFVNGLKRQYGVYYTINESSLVILDLNPPQTGDSHEIYYN
jgi:hypothetical protein